MNIFYLDEDPRKAAKMHYDTHVRKMIVESAQILSTAHRVLDGEAVIKLNSIGSRMTTWQLKDERNDILYKSTHVNHPCSIWVRESVVNYKYLYDLFVALIEEFHFRFNKSHATERLIKPLKSLPKNIPWVPATPFKLAVGKGIVDEDPVIAYREYYAIDKMDLCNYTKRDIPAWLKAFHP